MYDPAVGRFTTQDRFSEKYLEMAPYQYAANNPVRLIDVNGDSLYIFNSLGQYVMPIDDGKEKVTGIYFENEHVDENGNSTFSNATTFGFNDLNLDREGLKSGVMRVSIVENSYIENAIEESGVNNQKENPWTFIERESRPIGNDSKLSGKSSGKMDYFGTSDIVQNNILHIVKSKFGEAVAYNPQDFGNFLWGLGGSRLGFGIGVLRTAATLNNAINGAKDNKHIPNYEHKILDDPSDQRAIINGYYFNKKKQTGGVYFPSIMGFRTNP